jgi:hypothetical protein
MPQRWPTSSTERRFAKGKVLLLLTVLPERLNRRTHAGIDAA